MSVEAKREAIFWISLSVSTHPCRAIRDLLSGIPIYWGADIRHATTKLQSFAVSPGACRARHPVPTDAIRIPCTGKAAASATVLAESERYILENPGSNVWRAARARSVPGALHFEQKLKQRLLR
jgi:hypothetical protein